MREKTEYYATLYVTDDSFRFGYGWHNCIHSAQLAHNGDYFKNIANAINKNYINKLQHEHRERYPERHNVLLSTRPEVIGSGDTEGHGSTYRGTFLVKLRLNPEQITTVNSYNKTICLNSQISAADVYGAYVEALTPAYSFKLFLNQPVTTDNLELDQIAIFKDNGIYYYMLKGDEFPMPVPFADMDTGNNSFPENHNLAKDGQAKFITSRMDYLYNHRFDGATLAGHVPSKEFMRKRGQSAFDGYTGFIATIARNDKRINASAQLDDLFPLNITRDFVPEKIDSQINTFGFFPQLEQQAILPPAPGPLKKEISLHCPLTQERLQNPVFNIEDGLVYSKDAIEKQLEIKGPDTVLFSDYFTNAILEAKEIEEELLICPITQEIMQKPVFCILDTRTYEESAITSWLAKTRTSPINRNMIPEGVEPKDVLFSHKIAKHVIADAQEAEHGMALAGGY